MRLAFLVDGKGWSQLASPGVNQRIPANSEQGKFRYPTDDYAKLQFLLKEFVTR
jgi:hypothetical protein